MRTLFYPQLQRSALILASKVAPGFIARRLANRFMMPTRYPRPAWEAELLQTGEAIQSKKGLCLWHFGPFGGKKRTPQLLLLHGWSGRGSQMGKFVKPLTEAGFGVFLLDGPAHGDSPGRLTHMNAFAAQVSELQEELGPFAATIGHSLGGAVSVLAASQGLSLTALVLIAAPSNMYEVFGRFFNELGLSDEMSQRFQSILEERIGEKLDDLNLLQLSANLKQPALLIHDERDKEVSFKDAENWQRAWQNSSLLKTEGLGHRRILMDPAVISAVLNFLQKKISLK